ncbi:MAG: 1-acyl-sn-glycerol-3-phosphate acyltransferase [Candidatus Uhrbacteria bacterium]
MRTFITYCRAWLAMCIAWGAIAVSMVVVVVGGIPYALCADPFIGRWIPNPFAWIPKWYSAFVTRLCYRWILGVRIVVSIRGSVRGRRLCIGNHPTALAMPVVWWVITRYIAPHVVTVGKREHAWNPFIGWPLIILRALILIDRRDHASALRSIRDGLRRTARAVYALVIFPDMRRPTPERILADREKFADRIPRLRAWLRYSLVPRIGGLAEILEHTDPPLPVVHLTQAFDVEEYGVFNVVRIVNRTIYVDIEEAMVPLPRDRFALANVLNAEWEKKHRRIAEWRRNV